MVGSRARCSGHRSCPTAVVGMGCGRAVPSPLLRGKQDFRRSKTFSIATKLAVIPSSWPAAGGGAGSWLLAPPSQLAACEVRQWASKRGFPNQLDPIHSLLAAEEAAPRAHGRQLPVHGGSGVPAGCMAAGRGRKPHATSPTAATSLGLLIHHSPRATSEVKHPSDSLGGEGGRQRHATATWG